MSIELVFIEAGSKDHFLIGVRYAFTLVLLLPILHSFLLLFHTSILFYYVFVISRCELSGSDDACPAVHYLLRIWISR